MINNSILINIQSIIYDDMGRYIYQLCKLLSAYIDNIYVSSSCNDLFQMQYAKFINDIPNVHINTQNLSDCYTINIDINNGIIVNGTYFGLSFHPNILRAEKHKLIYEYRKIYKNQDIIFSGNNEITNYSIPNAPIDRYRIINHIKSNYSNITILEKQNHNTLPINKWLENLASYKFQICCPGGKFHSNKTIILCEHGLRYNTHHLTECLSVGTVPIVYSINTFQNKIIHKYNGLIYSNLNELNDCIDLAHSMSIYEYNSIRDNAIKTYDELYQDFMQCFAVKLKIAS